MAIAFSTCLPSTCKSWEISLSSNEAYRRKSRKIYDFLLDNDQYGGRLDNYIMKVPEDGEWSGNSEIYALSETLNVRITLFQENLQVSTIGDSTSNHIKTIYFAYKRSSRHDSSVIPLQHHAPT